jgi:cbb3-type cytochrome oxidase subunit 1
MRPTAVSAAVVAFFALAGIGAACEVPPMVCGTRALVGAVVVYVLAVVVQRVVIRILTDLMAGHTKPTNPSEERIR